MTGRAHLATSSGQPPENPSAWGWRQLPAGMTAEWRPQGARIGWVEGEELYLIPDEAYACVRRLAPEGGEGLMIGPKTLSKRLQERGLLAGCDPGRGTLTVRHRAEGARHEVLHLTAGALSGAESDPSDPSDPPAPALRPGDLAAGAPGEPVATSLALPATVAELLACFPEQPLVEEDDEFEVIL